MISLSAGKIYWLFMEIESEINMLVCPLQKCWNYEDMLKIENWMNKKSINYIILSDSPKSC